MRRPRVHGVCSRSRRRAALFGGSGGGGRRTAAAITRRLAAAAACGAAVARGGTSPRGWAGGSGSPPRPARTAAGRGQGDFPPLAPPAKSELGHPPLRLWRVYSEEEQAADAEALDAAAAEWIGSDLNRWAWYEGLRTRRAELLGRANRETAAAEVEVGRLAEAIEELQAVLGVQLMRPPAPARRGGSTDDDDGRGGGGAGGAPPESGEELTAAGWAVVALALGLPIAAVVAVVSVVLRVAPKLFHVGLF